MAIESQFSYGKGYVYGYQSSNFAMSDASNIATIELMKFAPEGLFHYKDCFCIECASSIHAREAAFDEIKTTIERCMVVAFEEGRKFEREVQKEERKA